MVSSSGAGVAEEAKTLNLACENKVADMTSAAEACHADAIKHAEAAIEAANSAAAECATAEKDIASEVKAVDKKFENICNTIQEILDASKKEIEEMQAQMDSAATPPPGYANDPSPPDSPMKVDSAPAKKASKKRSGASVSTAAKKVLASKKM